MLTVQFISEPPHTNWDVEIVYPRRSAPTALIRKLTALGWTIFMVTGKEQVRERYLKPIINRWTDAERKANVLAVRRAMEPFGIHNISHKKLR